MKLSELFDTSLVLDSTIAEVNSKMRTLSGKYVGPNSPTVLKSERFVDMIRTTWESAMIGSEVIELFQYCDSIPTESDFKIPSKFFSIVDLGGSAEPCVITEVDGRNLLVGITKPIMEPGGPVARLWASFEDQSDVAESSEFCTIPENDELPYAWIKYALDGTNRVLGAYVPEFFNVGNDLVEVEDIPDTIMQAIAQNQMFMDLMDRSVSNAEVKVDSVLDVLANYGDLDAAATIKATISGYDKLSHTSVLQLISNVWQAGFPDYSEGDTTFKPYDAPSFIRNIWSIVGSLVSVIGNILSLVFKTCYFLIQAVTALLSTVFSFLEDMFRSRAKATLEGDRIIPVISAPLTTPRRIEASQINRALLRFITAECSNSGYCVIQGSGMTNSSFNGTGFNVYVVYPISGNSDTNQSSYMYQLLIPATVPRIVKLPIVSIDRLIDDQLVTEEVDLMDFISSTGSKRFPLTYAQDARIRGWRLSNLDDCCVDVDNPSDYWTANDDQRRASVMGWLASYFMVRASNLASYHGVGEVTFSPTAGPRDVVDLGSSIWNFSKYGDLSSSSGTWHENATLSEQDRYGQEVLMYVLLAAQLCCLSMKLLNGVDNAVNQGNVMSWNDVVEMSNRASYWSKFMDVSATASDVVPLLDFPAWNIDRLIVSGPYDVQTPAVSVPEYDWSVASAAIVLVAGLVVSAAAVAAVFKGRRILQRRAYNKLSMRQAKVAHSKAEYDRLYSIASRPGATAADQAACGKAWKAFRRDSRRYTRSYNMLSSIGMMYSGAPGAIPPSKVTPTSPSGSSINYQTLSEMNTASAAEVQSLNSSIDAAATQVTLQTVNDKIESIINLIIGVTP